MEMVTVRTFDNYFSANIILSRLQQAGMQAYLLDENSVTIYPVLANSIGGIKLNVDILDADRALELLKQFDEEYLRSVECPKCGTNNILLLPRTKPGNFITAIFTWLFSNYAAAVENVYQCQQCGYESKTLPENVSAYN